jgi:hypothetical protein
MKQNNHTKKKKQPEFRYDTKLRKKERRREGRKNFYCHTFHTFAKIYIEERYTLLRKESNGRLQSNKLRKEIIIFNIKETNHGKSIIIFNMFSLLAGFGADEKLVHTLSNNLTSL